MTGIVHRFLNLSFRGPFQIFFLPLFLFLLLLSAVTAPIWVLVVVLIQKRGERQFQRAMQAKQRWIAWPELEPRLFDGQGTIIIESAQKMPVRVWWTPEDLVAIAPFEPPPDGELDYFFIEEKAHPFVLWCHRRFLDEAHGTALLTEPTLELPGGLGMAGFFLGLYPKLSVIDTVYCLPHQTKQVFNDEPA